MKGFKITPKAYQGLLDIGQYTKQRWGKAKRDEYLKLLDQRFHWLVENPQLGKVRSDIDGNLYSYREGSHVIFYSVHDDHVVIVGIPHKAMDVIQYFDH